MIVKHHGRCIASAASDRTRCRQSTSERERDDGCEAPEWTSANEIYGVFGNSVNSGQRHVWQRKFRRFDGLLQSAGTESDAAGYGRICRSRTKKPGRTVTTGRSCPEVSACTTCEAEPPGHRAWSSQHSPGIRCDPDPGCCSVSGNRTVLTTMN